MTSILNSISSTQEDVQASSVFEAGILTLCDGTRLIAQETFTYSEMRVLVPLLRSHPHHCPYEILLAHFTNVSTNVSQDVVDSCRRRLYDALNNGTFDHELRPIRNVMSRTRIKLERLGIDVNSILETGYLLHPRPVEKARLRRGERQRVSA